MNLLISESLAKKIVIFYRLESFYRVGQDGKIRRGKIFDLIPDAVKRQKRIAKIYGNFPPHRTGNRHLGHYADFNIDIIIDSNCPSSPSICQRFRENPDYKKQIFRQCFQFFKSAFIELKTHRIIRDFGIIM